MVTLHKVKSWQGPRSHCTECVYLRNPQIHAVLQACSGEASNIRGRARCEGVTSWSHQHGFPHVDAASARLHQLRASTVPPCISVHLATGLHQPFGCNNNGDAVWVSRWTENLSRHPGSFMFPMCLHGVSSTVSASDSPCCLTRHKLNSENRMLPSSTCDTTSHVASNPARGYPSTQLT